MLQELLCGVIPPVAHSTPAGGGRIAPIDRAALNALHPCTGRAAALCRLHPGADRDRVHDGDDRLARMLDAIENGADPGASAERWNAEFAEVASVRAKYLLYQ